MNKRQRIAIRNAVAQAWEVAHPRFRVRVGTFWSVLVFGIGANDLAYFDGDPCWQASVSMGDDAGAIPVREWNDADRERAVDHLMDLLDGVGQRGLEDNVEVGEVAIHIRRRCTAVEKQQAPLLRLGEKPKPMPLN